MRTFCITCSGNEVTHQDWEQVEATVTYGTLRRMRAILKTDPRVDMNSLSVDALINEALTFQRHQYEHIRDELNKFQKRMLGK